jgi:hypothetical protein
VELFMLPSGMIAERRIVQRLMQSNAVTAEAAQPLAGLRESESKQLSHLTAAGVVRAAAPDRYYLHPPALADYWFGARRKRAILILAIVAAVIAVIAIAMVAPR